MAWNLYVCAVAVIKMLGGGKSVAIRFAEVVRFQTYTIPFSWPNAILFFEELP
jgi:hypothetical protein